MVLDNRFRGRPSPWERLQESALPVFGSALNTFWQVVLESRPALFVRSGRIWDASQEKPRGLKATRSIGHCH